MKFFRDVPLVLAVLSVLGSLFLFVGAVVMLLAQSHGLFREGEPEISDEKWYLSFSGIDAKWAKTPFEIPSRAECEEKLLILSDDERGKARCVQGSELRKEKP